MKKRFAFLALALGVLAGGCGLFWDDPYILVTEAPLNWCEIHYYNARNEPIRRDSVRITGSGFVEVRSGTSRRVSDSFAKNMEDPSWNDYSTQRFTVDPGHVREVFQSLVNAGLLDKDKMFASTKYPSPGRFIAVRAAFDNKTFSETYNIFEKDPELAERLLNVVHEFKRPTLGRKKSIYAQRKEKDDEAADDGESKDDKKETPDETGVKKEANE